MVTDWPLVGAWVLGMAALLALAWAAHRGLGS